MQDGPGVSISLWGGSNSPIIFVSWSLICFSSLPEIALRIRSLNERIFRWQSEDEVYLQPRVVVSLNTTTAVNLQNGCH
jgi:hypothetical protein